MAKKVRDDNNGTVWEYSVGSTKVNLGHNKIKNFWIVTGPSVTSQRIFKTEAKAMIYLNLLIKYYTLQTKITNYPY
jgi:hypothetical protein